MCSFNLFWKLVYEKIDFLDCKLHVLSLIAIGFGINLLDLLTFDRAKNLNLADGDRDDKGHSSLRDPLQGTGGPMTRARSRRMMEACMD